MLVVLRRAGYAPLPVHLAGKAGTFALLYAFPLLLLAEWDSWVGTVAGVVGWAFALWGVALYWFSAVALPRAGPPPAARRRASRHDARRHGPTSGEPRGRRTRR